MSIEARAAFLRRIHLFHDLKDEDLAIIAGMLTEEDFAPEEHFFLQGEEPNRFFIIYQGTVQITQVLGKEVRDLAKLVGGDYFGEQALLGKRKHTATVVAVQKTSVFSLTAEQFHFLLKKYPRLKAALEVAAYSRKLAREMHFDWLRPDEVIYFMARKHEVLLAQALSGPLLASAVPIIFAVYFFITRSFFTILGAGISSVIIAAWAVWNYIDWGNDYYILTNQRVVWLEKVVGVYDSRQEAPLTTVLSVGVETDQTGRLLDYGNVIVRTFVGKIPFSHVPRPYEAAHLVEEQWIRTKHSASRSEKEAMRNVLRQKMGLTVETKVEEREKSNLQTTPTFYRRSILKVIGSNWFNMRLEDSGTITYRKHWYVLIKQIWEPSVLFFLLIAGMLIRLITLIRTPGKMLIDPTRAWKVDTVILVLPVILIPVVIWWIYQYIDWRNDIFQVTPDQIIDIDKKPFGTEERRAAPLENILSTESERVGFTGYILNYGTVYITVGGAHLDFEDVLDPTAVQADIDRRREARIARKKEVEVASERERMSDWLVAYYENEPELRQQHALPQPEPEPKPKSE
jgi:hypothetical protein